MRARHLYNFIERVWWWERDHKPSADVVRDPIYPKSRVHTTSKYGMNE